MEKYYRKIMVYTNKFKYFIYDENGKFLFSTCLESDIEGLQEVVDNYDPILAFYRNNTKVGLYLYILGERIEDM